MASTFYGLTIAYSGLNAYQAALKNNDLETLTALLEEGKRCKEEVDG